MSLAGPSSTRGSHSVVPPASEDVVIPVTIPGHADFQRDPTEPAKAAPITQLGEVIDPLSNADYTFTREYEEGVHCVPKEPWPEEGPLDYVFRRVLQDEVQQKGPEFPTALPGPFDSDDLRPP